MKPELLKVVVTHGVDTCPNFSMIGEYTNKPSPWAIVRENGEYVFNLPADFTSAAGLYFIPFAGGEKPGTEDYQKNGKQDFARMEAYNKGQWYNMSIKAVAHIQVGDLVQQISSGIMTIYSDASEDDIAAVEREQLAILRNQLKILNVEKKDVEVQYER